MSSRIFDENHAKRTSGMRNPKDFVYLADGLGGECSVKFDNALILVKRCRAPHSKFSKLKVLNNFRNTRPIGIG